MKSAILRLRFLLLLFLIGCSSGTQKSKTAIIKRTAPALEPYIVVLGIAQDGGYPQTGCHKNCCKAFYEGKEPRHYVSCLGIVDLTSGERWMIDATPDFPEQLHLFDSIAPSKEEPGLNGIFLSHAHIGHYTGLMYLGREVMGARNVPVYALPKMEAFLEHNGPWDLLVRLKNIELRKMKAEQEVKLNRQISITPFLVPHRGEYSETAGFRIKGPNKSIIYISDIDQWEEWSQDIKKVVLKNDMIFIDGTFFSGDELPGRDMTKIPHPTIIYSMNLLKNLSREEKSKIYFIHLNHTNPALLRNSQAYKTIIDNGYNVSREGMRFSL